MITKDQAQGQAQYRQTIISFESSFRSELDRTNCDFPTPCDAASLTKTTSNPLFRASNETHIIQIINQKIKVNLYLKSCKLIAI